MPVFSTFAMEEEQPLSKYTKEEVEEEVVEPKQASPLSLRELSKKKFIEVVPVLENLPELLESIPAEEVQQEIKLHFQKPLSYEETQLHNARSEKEVENLLTLGLDPNIKDRDERTAVNALINKDRLKEAAHLIALKSKEESALKEKKSEKETEESLAQKELERKPLDISSPDIYGVTPLQRAIQTGNLELVNEIINLLRQQNKFDEQTITTQNKAKESAFSMASRYLPDLLPDFLALLTKLNIPILNKLTPLTFAAFDRPELVELLLKAHADPDFQNESGDTPLTLAVHQSNKDIVQLLLDAKADVNLPNNKGLTPLILAVEKKDPAMVQLLLQYGANPNIQNPTTKLTAVKMAMRNNQNAILQMLLKAGGNIY